MKEDNNEDKTVDLFYVVYKEDKNCFPVDWSVIPFENIEDLDSDKFYNVLGYSVEKEELVDKTVIYLKPTKKFRKNTKEINCGSFILGI